MKVLVVGVGALGSHVIQAIRNLPIDITVADFDVVESKNTQSQFMSVRALGKTKSNAVKDQMWDLWKKPVESKNVRVMATNVEAVLRPANLVIDCVDNLATRRLLSIEASRTKKPLLHGAISANGDYARSIWDERFEADEEPSTGNTATCENGDHLPFVMITSAYIAQAIKTYVIKGVKENFEISPTHVRRYLT